MKCTCKELAALCPKGRVIAFSCPKHGAVTIDLKRLKTNPRRRSRIVFSRTLAYGAALPNPGLVQ
jgi:hypothetical protein